MKKLKGLIVVMVFFLLSSGLCGCEDKHSDTVLPAKEQITYEQISQQQAKQIMDSEDEYVIIDSRTEEEFAQGHIRDAILIPEYEIAARAEKEIKDKDTLILVYCRSGRRSKIASQELVNLGYTNVKEFGGIIDWQYEIVE